MHLFTYESLMRKLRTKRQELGLTQKEVAAQAGISAAQLSRMENGNAEAKYRTVYRVWKELDTVADTTEQTAEALATPDITWITTAQTGREARRLMWDNNYSQLPVCEPEHQEAVGGITDRLLMLADELRQPITELMGPPFIEVRPETSRSAVVELLQDGNDAVLVRPDGTGQYTGIITPADVL